MVETRKTVNKTTRWGAMVSRALCVMTCAALGCARTPNIPTPTNAAPPDLDQDGVIDADDACVSVPEDLDQIADDDGCPEEDADGDLVIDKEDLCPFEPETRNGFEDMDGCPDEGLSLCRDCRATKKLVAVLLFEPGSSELARGQDESLEEVAELLLEHPKDAGRVQIIGHSSSWGEEVDQVDLARSRAEYVSGQLIYFGVDPSALRVLSRSSREPRVPHAARDAAHLNDRVEVLLPPRRYAPE